MDFDFFSQLVDLMVTGMCCDSGHERCLPLCIALLSRFEQGRSCQKQLLCRPSDWAKSGKTPRGHKEIGRGGKCSTALRAVIHDAERRATMSE